MKIPPLVKIAYSSDFNISRQMKKILFTSCIATGKTCKVNYSERGPTAVSTSYSV
jgi:hypothetical protein